MSIAVIYHQSERDRAEEVVSPLRDAGYVVAMAPLGLQVGTPNWQERVRADFTNAEMVLVLLSVKSVQDEWVAWRTAAALELNVDRFIPIMLDDEIDGIEWVLPKQVNYFNRMRWRQENSERFLSSITSTLPAPSRNDQFDVFLAHNSADKLLVTQIADELRYRGLIPWLDKEQIPPGSWFQDVIQNAIRTARSAAVFLGQSGVGKWQAIELKSFVSQCVDLGTPVIPVLLPGVADVPPDLVFLREMNWVVFKDTVDDSEAINNLQWGITGVRPSG